MKLQGNKDLHTVDGEDRAEKEAGVRHIDTENEEVG